MKYEIKGTLYGETPKYYSWDKEKQFDYYEEVIRHTWTIEADSIEEAERWLIDNYPECYMGAAIICKDNTDFLMTAVPSGEYEKGNYETIQARIKTAQKFRR